MLLAGVRANAQERSDFLQLQCAWKQKRRDDDAKHRAAEAEQDEGTAMQTQVGRLPCTLQISTQLSTQHPTILSIIQLLLQLDNLC